MATREEAFAAIDAAQKAMAEAVRLASVARRVSTEAGVITAADIIQEGLTSARQEAFGKIPVVTGYIGTGSSQEDIDAIQQATKEVVEAARAAGQVIAFLVKAAIKLAT